MIEIAFHDEACETAQRVLDGMIGYTMMLWPDTDLRPDVPGGLWPRDVVLLEVFPEGSRWYGTVRVVDYDEEYGGQKEGAEPYDVVIKRVEVY